MFLFRKLIGRDDDEEKGLGGGGGSGGDERIVSKSAKPTSSNSSTRPQEKWRLNQYTANTDKISKKLIEHAEQALGGSYSADGDSHPGRIASTIDDELGRITITLTSVKGLIKDGFAIFRAKKQGEVSFAHDMGTVDSTTWATGVWDMEKDALVPSGEAGKALAQKELSKDEALEIAKQLLARDNSRVDLGESCSRGNEGRRDPQLTTAFDKKNRLEFSVLDFVGMRGCIFDAFVLILPQSVRDDGVDSEPLQLVKWRSLHPDYNSDDDDSNDLVIANDEEGE